MKIYKRPIALTMQDWGKFYETVKERFPVQYFIRETLPKWISHNISIPVNRIFWRFNHRFIPRYQFHIIRPRSLEPGYHDPQQRIMHAAFDDLSLFAERSLMGNGIKGTRWSQKDVDNEDKMFRDSFLEQVEREAKIVALRNWWVVERPKREQIEDELLEKAYGDMTGESFRDLFSYLSSDEETPERKRRKQYSNKLRQLEEQWDKEDNEKLHELVDLLPHLWYA